jgi:hypothetical protein
LIVLSHDPDASVCPSGENATDVTPFVWLSSVCRHALQVCSTLGSCLIHLGIACEKTCRTALFSGAKMSAEE